MWHVFVLSLVLEVGLKVRFGFLLHQVGLYKAIYVQSFMSMLLSSPSLCSLAIVLLEVFELELFFLN